MIPLDNSCRPMIFFYLFTRADLVSFVIYRVSQKKVDPLRLSTIFSLGLSLFA